MHLGSDTVDMGSVIVDIVDKFDKLGEFARVGLKVIVIDEELGSVGAVLGCALESLDGIVKSAVISPVEVGVAGGVVPVEVEAVGLALGRSLVLIILSAHPAAVDATEPAVIADRFVDNIP